MNARDWNIITDFCEGSVPSEIDRRYSLVEGCARGVIVSWWLDDKWNRTGGIERFLGSKWRTKVKTRGR